MVYVTTRSILYPLFKGMFAEISGGEHVPTKGPYLLAANHIDYLDGFFIAMAMHELNGHEVYFLTKSNNYWWTRAALPIDPARKADSIDDAVKYLREGRVICNFIEGSRNVNPHLLRGKTGTARLSLLADVPVIPVGIAGPSGKNFLQSVTNLITERGSIRVVFGEPIDLGPFKGKGLEYGLLQEATLAIMHGIVPLTEKVYIR